jgi:MFS family permease
MALRDAAVDLTPLRVSPPFRKLFLGQAVSAIGTQVTIVAVALEMYDITHSSFYVGLVGVAGLIPLIAFGLYGGAIADAMDRRRLIFITSTGMVIISGLLMIQSLAGFRNAPLLFGCVALQAGFSAVDMPARRAVIPQLIAPDKLAPANTLSMASTQLAVIVGPMIAGLAVNVGGFQWAYAVDVISFVGVFYGAFGLPNLKPEGAVLKPGLASVIEGLRFVAGRKVVMMTFVLDLIAMVFGMPRALFPALADHQYHGGAGAAGLLYAAPAAGAFAATLVSGAINRVNRHGLGVVVSFLVWGAAITVFGWTSKLWVALVLLAVAGAGDTVSAVYRVTMLQVATPPNMQGRLQGVLIVATNSGPRLGDLEAGVAASVFSTQFAVVSGGIACVAGVALCAVLVPSFLRYDAKEAAKEFGYSSAVAPEIASG